MTLIEIVSPSMVDEWTPLGSKKRCSRQLVAAWLLQATSVLLAVYFVTPHVETLMIGLTVSLFHNKINSD